jgi:hypothetical protein
MDMKDKLQTAEITLILGFVLVLICTALVFLFLLLIDWRDTILGVPVEELPAAVSLLVKAAAAMVIAYIFARQMNHIIWGILANFGYWGFLFIDSAIVIMKTHVIEDSSLIVLGIFFFFSVLLLIIHSSITRYGTGGEGRAEPS